MDPIRLLNVFMIYGSNYTTQCVHDIWIQRLTISTTLKFFCKTLVKMISFLLIYMTRMIHYDILSQLNTNLISVNEFVSMAMTLNITMLIMLKIIIQAK